MEILRWKRAMPRPGWRNSFYIWHFEIIIGKISGKCHGKSALSLISDGNSNEIFQIFTWACRNKIRSRRMCTTFCISFSCESPIKLYKCIRKYWYLLFFFVLISFFHQWKKISLYNVYLWNTFLFYILNYLI